MKVYPGRLAAVFLLLAAGGVWAYSAGRPLPIDPPRPPVDEIPVGYTRLDPSPEVLELAAKTLFTVTDYRGRPYSAGESVLDRTGPDEWVWRWATDTVAAVNGKTTIAHAETVQVFEARPPHRLVRFIESAAGAPTRELAPGPDGGWRLTTRLGEVVHTRPVPRVDFTLADITTFSDWVDGDGRRAGDRVTVRCVDMLGGRVEAVWYELVRVTPDPAGGPPETEVRYTYANGRRGTTANRGERLLWQREGVSTTREAAARPDPSGWVPPVVPGNVDVSARLPDPAQVTGLRVRLYGEPARWFADGPGQRVRPNRDGSVEVETHRTRFPVRATAEDRETALEDTFEFPHGRPEVHKLLDEAVPPSAHTARQKVNALVTFLPRFVTFDMAADPPTVPDVIRERRGVCRHTADLFVTLCRAAGVPARRVSGLAWAGGGFGYHRWADVALDDGCWHPVDPTWGQTHATTHLRGHHPWEPDTTAGDRIDGLAAGVISWGREPAMNPTAALVACAAVVLLAGLRWGIRPPAPPEPEVIRLPDPAPLRPAAGGGGDGPPDPTS